VFSTAISILIGLLGNKKSGKTNNLKPYLTSVSGVDKFWVRGHLDTAHGTVMSVKLVAGLQHYWAHNSAVILIKKNTKIRKHNS